MLMLTNGSGGVQFNVQDEGNFGQQSTIRQYKVSSIRRYQRKIQMDSEVRRGDERSEVRKRFCSFDLISDFAIQVSI